MSMLVLQPFGGAAWQAAIVLANTDEGITVALLLQIGEHGRVSGRVAMKKELYKRGPLSCVIDATRGLDEYSGGIYAEHKPNAHENHIISVVGWGRSNDDIEYWIVRLVIVASACLPGCSATVDGHALWWPGDFFGCGNACIGRVLSQSKARQHAKRAR